MTGMMKERDWGKSPVDCFRKDDPEKKFISGNTCSVGWEDDWWTESRGDINCLCSEKEPAFINKEVKRSNCEYFGIGTF